MKKPAVIMGMGQMGGVFARGLLSVGHPVYPVLREMSMQKVSDEIEDPVLVLVAVAEGDLAGVLDQLPDQWKARLGLLQNELLPNDWETHDIDDPTVVAVWFEKKVRRPVTPLWPSPVFGPQSGLIERALAALNIPVEVLEHKDELVGALVMKNLYILTANIAGLVGADTVGGLLEENYDLTRRVFEDVLALQEALTGRSFEASKMWSRLEQIFREAPEHGSRGRSAPQRLDRALEESESLGLELTSLIEIKGHTAKP